MDTKQATLLELRKVAGANESNAIFEKATNANQPKAPSIYQLIKINLKQIT